MDPPSRFHYPFLAALVPLYLFRLISLCIPSGHLQGPDTWEEPSFLENPAFSHLPVSATSPLLVWLVILQGPAQNFDHFVQNSAPHSKTGESRPVGWEQGRRTGSNEEGFFCLLDFFLFLAMMCGLWDLGGHWTCATLQWEGGVLATGVSQNSPISEF